MNVAVTSGNLNACTTGLPYSIDTYTDYDNTNEFVPMIDSSFKLIASVDANGNTLNNVTGSVYINSGSLRTDGNGRFYIDRNITLHPDAQPVSPVNVALFISNDELKKLAGQAGSGVSSIKDIRISQNDDNCASEFTNAATAFITPIAARKYDATHYVVSFVANSLSSFYLHGGNTPLVPKTNAVRADASAANITTSNIVNLYPNPVRDNLTIGLNVKSSGKYNVSITDMRGKIVKTFIRMVAAGYNEINVECSNISAGVYFIRLENGGTARYKKFLKQ
jgi:hypothetical protein